MNRTALAFAALASASIAGPALAHHSFAMFDQQKIVTIEGTVKEFEWTNPHSWLYVMVPSAAGPLQEYSIEMGSPVQQSRVGWAQDSVKAGDRVSMEFNPLKDGSRGGTIVSVTLPSGQKLTRGGQVNNPKGD